MSAFWVMVLCTGFAGLCMVFGAAVARVEHVGPRWLEDELRHSIIASGGGVLVAAVALVLIPEGTSQIESPLVSVLIVLGGGAAFFIFERFLGIRRRESPQLTAMLLDFLPESLALGGMFAIGAAAAPMLALLIGLQNLPEGFNAFRELRELPNFRPVKALLLIAALAPLGPLIGALGWWYGPGHAAILGGAMLFASGGILYLIFQDVAPQSHLERHWGPALGAVFGFAVGMLGKLLVHGGG